MIYRAKNEVFGRFLKFGMLDQLDIAYCDSNKCLPTCIYISAMLPDRKEYSKVTKNASLNDTKCQKGGFWPLSGLWYVGST